jgi:putative ABC transport system permease protein
VGDSLAAMILEMARSSTRALFHSWRLVSVSVLLLAGGISACEVLFAVSDAVMFRRFPFAAQERLIIATEHLPGAPRAEVSYANYQDWRTRTHAFDDLAAMASTNWTFTMRATEPVVAYRAVSRNFFDVLGTHAALGRTFQPSEDAPGAARVVIISDGLWRSQFRSDSHVLGRAVTLSDRPFTIVGVMPRGFNYPAGADLWTPLVPALADIRGPSLPDFLRDRSAAVLHVVGRLRPSINLTFAHSDLDRVIRELSAESGRPRQVSSSLTPLIDDLLGSVRVGLWALLAAVGLLLLAIIANVSGLMLIRTATRHREFSIRVALGASTTDLAVQLLFESGVIVAAAAAGAFVVSRLALPVIQSVMASSIPRVDEAAVDVRVVGFVAVVAAMSCVSCWIVPALQVRQVGLGMGLRTGSREAASGRLNRNGRRWLVAIEVATAMVTLAGAGLLYRSVERLNRVDLGFDPHNLLAADIELPESRSASRTRADVYAFYERTINEIATMPFVQSVAAVGQRPLKGPIGLDASWEFEGQGAALAKDNPWVNLEPITPTYFATIATPLIAGRVFDDRDRADTQPVVIVNDKLARYAWPGGSAIGSRIHAGGLNLGRRSDTWWTVVGVVADIRYREIGATPLDVYVPFAQSWFPVGDLMIRTTVPAVTATSAVRTRLRQVDPNGIIDVQPMDRVVESQRAPWRTNLLLFGVFAGLTVLVASVGLFAMLTATVVGQSREIGVRAALGATRARIMREVLGEGMKAVVPGSVVGVIAFLASSGFLRSLLFDVSPVDGLTVLGAASALLIVAVGACAFPALRAAGVDPAVSLRSE